MRFWLLNNSAEVAPGAASSPAPQRGYFGLLSKDRFGFTSLYWDGVCLTISRKHQCYRSHRYTYHTIALNEKELSKLKEFLIDGNISGAAHMPAHEGNAEERFFCHPSELDREMRRQRKDVVQPAVVGDQQLRA